MGDLKFDKNGHPIKSVPLKKYEIILITIGGIAVGLLISLFLLSIGAIT